MKFNLDSNYQEILDTFRLRQDEFEKIMSVPLKKKINYPVPGLLGKQIDPLVLLRIVRGLCYEFKIKCSVTIFKIHCMIDELIINEV